MFTSMALSCIYETRGTRTVRTEVIVFGPDLLRMDQLSDHIMTLEDRFCNLHIKQVSRSGAC